MQSLKSTISVFVNKAKSNALAKDSFWALFGSFIGKGLALIAGIIVARFLGKDVYGEYGIIKNTLVYIAIVSSFGFGYTATKYIADSKEKGGETLRWLVNGIELFTFLFSLVLSFLLWRFASPIALFLKAPELAPIFRQFFSIIIFNAITTTQVGILSGFKMFKENAKVNGISGIVVFVFSVGLTYLWGLKGAVVALMASFLVQSLLNEWYIRRALRSIKNHNKGTRASFLSMLSFSLPIALQESLYTIIQWLKTYLLILFANYGEVGLSSAAGTWGSIVIFIPGVLKNVMFSHLTTSPDHKTLVNRLLLINLVSTVLPVLCVIVCSGLISSFYGPTFEALPVVLNISMLSAVFVSLSEVYCYEFISKGKPWTVFSARFFRDSSNLLLGWLFLSNVSGRQAMYLSCASLIGNVLFFVVLWLFYLRTEKDYASQ